MSIHDQNDLQKIPSIIRNRYSDNCRTHIIINYIPSNERRGKAKCLGVIVVFSVVVTHLTRKRQIVGVNVMGKRKRMRLADKDKERLGIKFDVPIPKAIQKADLTIKKAGLVKKTSIWSRFKNLFGF
jgi:hypothetical protein